MAQNERNTIEREGGESSSKGPRLPDRRPRLSLWIYLAIFLALLVHFLLFLAGENPNTIEYSTFLDYVEQGYVERVEIINDARIQGTYTSDAVREGRVQVPEPRQDLLGATTPDARRRFVTTKPGDHDLTDFLREHNERVEAGERSTRVAYTARQEENWFGGLLTWIFPLILIVALWVFLLRRMNPGSQVLNIGKNKAVLFDAMGEQRLTFKDVAGLEEAKEEVVEVVEFLKNPKRFTRLGGKLPKGVLLVGPPGTGKTLLAKAVAGEAGVPFFSLSGSDFVEMFVGVGAARVRDLFRQAKEKAPCIIFIDEIDAIGRSRGRGMMMGANDERENTLNQLLVEMDGFNTDKGVIIMAATNRPDVLDSALLRPGRFDRQILIDRPDRIQRAEIFKVHTRNLILGDDVNLEVLAGQTPGFAGAEIANVCNEAALLAARRDKEAINMEDFEAAIDRVIAGLEKKNKLISPEEREIVAYHEAGHAITGWFLRYTDPVIKVSIVPRGLAALGYAQSLPDERYLYTREAYVDRMTMAMGGRVAEEIVFGRISNGAQNDLERITKMAYAMVTYFGMSERIGYVSYNPNNQQGEGPLFGKPYSEETARMIDEEVRGIIDEVRRRARELLMEKRDRLDAMAKVLLEKEVLGPRDLVEILGPRPHGEYVSYNGHETAPGEPADSTSTDEQASSADERASSTGASDAEGDGLPEQPLDRDEAVG
ncbi:AAA family ATPase [Rhodothermaceae bacterium RA]|nr:AAA family ATPase [Rhodothermaceae bacterium RA]